MHGTTLSAPSSAIDRSLGAVDEPFDPDVGIFGLDLVNTLRDRFDPIPRDQLHDYGDLCRFAEAAGAIDADTAEQLAALAAAKPAEAATIFQRTTDLREALFRIVAALAADNPVQTDDLDTLSAAVADAAAGSRIVADGDAFRLRFVPDVRLERPLWEAANSVIGILLGDDRRRLRLCASALCGWVFLDTSRNHSRRWCSMSSCGNRTKVQQFRARQREATDDHS